jgi:hypothetical protein
MALLGKRDPRIAELEKLRDAAVRARLPFDREAWLNLAFYLDEHYVEWNTDTNSIRRIPRDSRTKNAPRPVVNKIMHFVQQERAMVMQTKPLPDVMPATDDLLDIGDAAVASAYLMHLSDPTVGNLTRQLGRAALWALICGDGWLKWVWNDREKRPDFIPCSFFEVYADPYAKEFAKARHVFHSQFLDTEQVYELFGIEVAAQSVQKADLMRTEMMRGMGSAPVLEGVEVHELWAKPSRRHPNGQYAVWTSKQFLVEPGPHPYEHKRLPFTQIGALERPDSQHYMSPVKFLRSGQMELNKYHAQKIMSREAFVNYKWWIDNEILMEADPTDAPREILRGNGGPGGKKPEILVPPPLPDNGDGAMIEEQMMHIVGLHEVSNAQVPGRVEAAKAIEMLKESDADRLSTMLDTISASLSEGGYQTLMLAKQFVPDETLVQVYGADGLPEVKHFKKSEIKPGMRVRITMGTGLARSRAARQDQLLSWWQAGILRDPQQMAELMEIPIPQIVPRARDMRLARNENQQMMAGHAVTPNSWDDHAIHLREHNEERKSQDFLTASEEVKEKFEYHCQLHEKMEEQQLARQAHLAMLAQGAQPAPAGQAKPESTSTTPQEAPPA